MIIDVSGSMGERPELWRSLAQLSRELLDSLPPPTYIEIMSFSELVAVNAGFQRDREKLRDRLNAVFMQSAHGHTRLWDALEAAAAHLAQAGDGGDIFLVTDGGSNLGKSYSSKLGRQLRDRNVRLFSLLLRERDFRTVEEREALPRLMEMAAATGGDVLPRSDDIGDIRQLPGIAQLLVGTATHSTSVVVDSVPRISEWRKVKVTLGNDAIKEAPC